MVVNPRDQNELPEEVRAHIKRAKKLLFKTLNCCESQIIPFQEKLGVRYDELLQASTGLAGGLYNHGSTCGVVIGTSLNYALQFYEEKTNWSSQDEIALLCQVRKYITWFREVFQSSLCRERTGLDFTTTRGKIGLLIPSKAKGCVLQTHKSVKYFLEEPHVASTCRDYAQEYTMCSNTTHCAREVMKRVREKTGKGNEFLEQMAVIFDGGIGLTGNTCGALIGGIMLLGLEFRKYHTLEKAGSIRSLLKSFPPRFVKHADSLIAEFTGQFKSLECKGVLQREFKDACEFKAHMEEKKCDPIIDFVSKEVLKVLMRGDKKEGKEEETR